MSISFEEHDYIGLLELPKMEISEKIISKKDLNLKATELRLGLPLERVGWGWRIRMCTHSGFFDTINGGGSGKWVFSGGGGGGSEAELGVTGVEA